MNGPVTVVAGGWSASQFNLRKLPGTIIGVNDAGVLLPVVDIIVSMDRLWAENRWDTLQATRKPTWLRRSTLKKTEIFCRPVLPTWVTPFECDHKSTVLSDVPGTLNGTHSGFCALNLAYQLRPCQLFLVGFDMKRGPKGEAHWFQQYPWVDKHATSAGRFAEWAEQFEGAALQLKAAGIDTYLASNHTAVPLFKRIGRAALEALCVT